MKLLSCTGDAPQKKGKQVNRLKKTTIIALIVLTAQLGLAGGHGGYSTTKRRAAYIVYRHWDEIGLAYDEATRMTGRDASKWTEEQTGRVAKAVLGLCAFYNQEEFPGQPWSAQMYADCVYFLAHTRESARAYLISQVLMSQP
jgi:hypothetical protein